MSATVTVSNSLELATALKAAATTTTPETILLQSGTYSDQTLYSYDPRANVTIESANPNAKAVIDGLQAKGSSNFTFNNITFMAAPGTTAGDMVTSYFDKNVNFTNDNFLGRTSNSFETAPAVGLVVGDSANTAVTGSTFEYVQNGIGQKENNGLTISNNKFTNIFGDGIDNAASTNVRILNNSFTNLHIASADTQHSDAIQFWTSGEKTAGGNITITGNTYNIGSGGPAQGIFITDQVGDLTYSNVTIENNSLVGTGWNGITLQHVSGATVENNTLESVSSTGQTSRLTLDGRVSGLIENNKIGQFVSQGGNTATVTGDAVLAPISLSAAQALVSGMASVTSSSSTPSTAPSTQLAQYDAYLAAHAVSAPKA